MAPAEIAVEVVYALPDEQVVVRLRMAPGATVGQAVQHSQLLARYPHINASAICAGVFGNVVTMDVPLNNGDRVEIYRPLTVDPKDARRRRVALRASKKSGT